MEPFTISLLNNTPLTVWWSGTLTLVTSGNDVTGTLSVTNEYSDIPLTGTIVNPSNAGPVMVLSGKTAQCQVDMSIVTLVDGFLFDGTYLGGTVSLFDTYGEETLSFAISGSNGDVNGKPLRTLRERPQ